MNKKSFIFILGDKMNSNKKWNLRIDFSMNSCKITDVMNIKKLKEERPSSKFLKYKKMSIT